MKPHEKPLALLVDNSASDRLQVRLQLELLGFTVQETDSFTTAEKMLEKRKYSILLMDPEASPVEAVQTCRAVRDGSSVPIIMLLHPDGTVTDELALDAGAHDFVIKPVHQRVLALRIRQHCEPFRAVETPAVVPVTWGSLTLDINQRIFTINNEPVTLTNAEFQFMQLLMEKPRQIFSRDQIIDAIGSFRGLGSDHIVDNHASRIRKKVKENGGPDVISVVRSVGFRLSAHDNH